MSNCHSSDLLAQLFLTRAIHTRATARLSGKALLRQSTAVPTHMVVFATIPLLIGMLGNMQVCSAVKNHTHLLLQSRSRGPEGPEPSREVTVVLFTCCLIRRFVRIVIVLAIPGAARLAPAEAQVCQNPACAHQVSKPGLVLREVQVRLVAATDPEPAAEQGMSSCGLALAPPATLNTISGRGTVQANVPLANSVSTTRIIPSPYRLTEELFQVR
jgi:hypothetical protein